MGSILAGIFGDTDAHLLANRKGAHSLQGQLLRHLLQHICNVIWYKMYLVKQLNESSSASKIPRANETDLRIYCVVFVVSGVAGANRVAFTRKLLYKQKAFIC